MTVPSRVRRRWFDRRFALGLPASAFPDIVERLRGTPARVEERTASWSPEILIRRVGDAWSIQEHVGHLGDLEPLWSTRLDELLLGADVLSPADLENRRTHEAGHAARPLDALLAEFRRRRQALVSALDGVPDDQLARTAKHPRLNQPMTTVDLCFFVAEHDDHHLATMTRLGRP